MEIKNHNVPLEEALAIAGCGRYTYYVMLVTGLFLFSSILGMQVMSIVIPVASCDLQLSVLQKGLLTSMAFCGMIFSSHLFGFLADTIGRKRIMSSCNIASVVFMILSSLSPNAYALMAVIFANGFMLGGVFTPSYVYVSEFCPQTMRSRGLLAVSAINSLGCVYLPCVAWFIMPLEINLRLPGGLVFTSWRLYLALLCLPSVLTNLLLRRLPETPKYLLYEGKTAETLEVLRSIYAVNRRRGRHEFPVDSVCLDEVDRGGKVIRGEGSAFAFHVKSLARQTTVLFKPPYLLFTVISCLVLFVVVGTYNTVMLWIPEQTRQLMAHSERVMEYNATLCDVMSVAHETGQGEDESCKLDYQIFVPSMVIGSCMSLFFLLVGLVSHKISSKLLTVCLASMVTGACFLLMFARILLLTVFSMGVIVVLLLTMFPICLSIAVDIFPTSLRSTATSIIMLFARLGSALGSQVMGAMFQSHCLKAYSTVTALLVGVIIMCLFLPTKKKV